MKPRFGASSAFVDESSICQTTSEVRLKASELYQHGADIIVEEFIDGIFYCSPVLCTEEGVLCLPPVKETSDLKGNVITYLKKRKLQLGLHREIALEQELNSRICSLSQKLSAFIQPFDYTRFDYIVTDEGDIYFLEFNLCCNLGKQSAFIMSANSVGYSQEAIVRKILANSLKRQGVI